MSQAPTSPVNFITEHGHSAPMCTQFSVFLQNRVGKLTELIEEFEDHDIRLVAFSILEASDHAVVRLVTAHSDDTRRLLRGNRYPFSETELLVVELAPQQTLAQLCRALLCAELNIAYSYSLIVRPHGAITVAVRCDDQTFASQVLQKKGYKLVDEQDLSHAAGDDPNVT